MGRARAVSGVVSSQRQEERSRLPDEPYYGAESHREPRIGEFFESLASARLRLGRHGPGSAPARGSGCGSMSRKLTKPSRSFGTRAALRGHCGQETRIRSPPATQPGPQPGHLLQHNTEEIDHKPQTSMKQRLFRPARSERVQGDVRETPATATIRARPPSDLCAADTLRCLDPNSDGGSTWNCHGARDVDTRAPAFPRHGWSSEEPLSVSSTRRIPNRSPRPALSATCIACKRPSALCQHGFGHWSSGLGTPALAMHQT